MTLPFSSAENGQKYCEDFWLRRLRQAPVFRAGKPAGILAGVRFPLCNRNETAYIAAVP